MKYSACEASQVSIDLIVIFQKLSAFFSIVHIIDNYPSSITRFSRITEIKEYDHHSDVPGKTKLLFTCLEYEYILYFVSNKKCK